ncbi:MAG: nitroreductase family protein [Anaerolineaceae bacterium]|jgi:nitroreductase/NAD-dependent dihydropyrimidine dehydrogenase PreA subunit|nr:nitroreductase family protein [Anaerolineaceae bacterium]
MSAIKINVEKCIGCGACVDVCNVTHVYKMQEEKAVVSSERRCWQCGQCVAVCPVDAIEHADFPLEKCPPVEKFTDTEIERMNAVMQSRRSVRVFKNKPVERSVIEDLIRKASGAPSAKNRQAVDWIAMDEPDKIASLREKTIAVLGDVAKELRIKAEGPDLDEALQRQHLMYAKSLEFLERRQERGEDALFYNAPVLLLAHVPNGEFGEADAVYAGYGLMLAAHLRGLGSCQIGYFGVALDQDMSLQNEVGVPEGREIKLAMIIGYQKYRYRREIPRRMPDVKWVG